MTMKNRIFPLVSLTYLVRFPRRNLINKILHTHTHSQGNIFQPQRIDIDFVLFFYTFIRQRIESLNCMSDSWWISVMGLFWLFNLRSMTNCTMIYIPFLLKQINYTPQNHAFDYIYDMYCFHDHCECIDRTYFSGKWRTYRRSQCIFSTTDSGKEQISVKVNTDLMFVFRFSRRRMHQQYWNKMVSWEANHHLNIFQTNSFVSCTFRATIRRWYHWSTNDSSELIISIFLLNVSLFQ